MPVVGAAGPTLETIPASTITQTFFTPSIILSSSTTVIDGTPTTFVVTQTSIGIETQTLTLPPRTGELQSFFLESLRSDTCQQ